MKAKKLAPIDKSIFKASPVDAYAASIKIRDARVRLSIEDVIKKEE